MIEILKTPCSFKILSIAGALIAVVGSLWTAVVYRGREAEAYSPLNHFISELGEVGISRSAWVFNLSLILTGLCLVPASISLGLMLTGLIAKIAMVAGVVCALSLSFVGVFPMNRLKPHGSAALTYFRAGLVMVFLFSLAVALQPDSQRELSPWYALAGLPAIMAFSTFLFLLKDTSKHKDDPLSTVEVKRPRIWRLAVVEWLIFFTILLWFLLISIGIAA